MSLFCATGQYSWEYYFLTKMLLLWGSRKPQNPSVFWIQKQEPKYCCYFEDAIVMYSMQAKTSLFKSMSLDQSKCEMPRWAWRHVIWAFTCFWQAYRLSSCKFWAILSILYLILQGLCWLSMRKWRVSWRIFKPWEEKDCGCMRTFRWLMSACPVHLQSRPSPPQLWNLFSLRRTWKKGGPKKLWNGCWTQIRGILLVDHTRWSQSHCPYFVLQCQAFMIIWSSCKAWYSHGTVYGFPHKCCQHLFPLTLQNEAWKIVLGFWSRQQKCVSTVQIQQTIYNQKIILEIFLAINTRLSPWKPTINLCTLPPCIAILL